MKTEIPWALHLAIIKVQASEELDYEEACLRASQLMDTNSKEYRKAVEVEANRLKKSQLMSEINKNKKTWRKKGYNSGYTDGDNAGHQRGVQEYRISYPCSVCGGELVMTPGAKDHEAAKMMMKQAGWAHSTCLKDK